jgi:hypothetical protein
MTNFPNIPVVNKAVARNEVIDPQPSGAQY